MNKLLYTLTKETVSVFYPKTGKQYTFQKDMPDFDELLRCLKSQDDESFEQLFVINPAQHLRHLSDGSLDFKDGEIWVGTPVGDRKLPQDLYDALMELKALEMPYTPLVNFAMKLFQHPEPDSVDQFYAYIRKHGLQLCEDGDFLAYKGVGDNFESLHAGKNGEKFDNAPGKSVSMPRDEVCKDRGVLCAEGLHVASWQYVQDCYAGAKKIVVKVDPRNVVSVPIDHNDAKIRTCGYLSLQEVSQPLAERVSTIDKHVNYNLDLDPRLNLIISELRVKNENIFFYENEKEGFVLIAVQDDIDGYEVSDYEYDAVEDGDGNVYETIVINHQEFEKSVKLLKNKKSGYINGLLEFKQAYRKGLVKMLNVSKDLQDLVVHLG